MGNNKVKTAKQLQGKKGNGQKDLHPDSRRVKQAARVDLRTKRITADKKERHKLEQEKIDRLLWFIREMDPNVPYLTVDGLHEVVKSYLSRMDSELEEERKARRPGRPMSKRQQELEAVQNRELYQYEKEGLVLPDLCSAESAESARYWNDDLEGNAGYFGRLRLVRIFKGEQELAVEQAGEALGPNTKRNKDDAESEEASADMVEG